MFKRTFAVGQGSRLESNVLTLVRCGHLLDGPQ